MGELLDVGAAEGHVVVKHRVVEVGPPEARPDRSPSVSPHAQGGREVQDILVEEGLPEGRLEIEEQAEAQECEKEVQHRLRQMSQAWAPCTSRCSARWRKCAITAATRPVFRASAVRTSRCRPASPQVGQHPEAEPWIGGARRWTWAGRPSTHPQCLLKISLCGGALKGRPLPGIQPLEAALGEPQSQ